MPGNNWLPGEATFSRCGLTVRHGVWDAGIACSTHVTSTRDNGYPRARPAIVRTIAVATMRRRAFPSSAFERRLGFFAGVAQW